MLAAFFMDDMRGKNPLTEVNPFLRLSKRNFPQGEFSNGASVEDGKLKYELACENAQDEESRLFLQAMHILPMKKKPSCKKVDFVTLKEKCAAFRILSSKPAKPSLPGAASSHRNLQSASAKNTLLASQRTHTCDAHDTKLFTEDECTLEFARAMHGVQPLKNKGRDVPLDVDPPAVSEPSQQSFQELLENMLEFSLNISKEYIEGHVVGLESLILEKLRAGQYRPEVHLDLHGLNARQAFDALLGFIRHSWHRGVRTILLIPGRGRNSLDGVAVLRGRVQCWLTQDPLKRVVLAFCTAKPVDGGPGSLYVLLRKYKKKGKVYWERYPAGLDL